MVQEISADSRTDTELRVDQYNLEYRIAELQRELEKCKAEWSAIRAELDRRQLEAFWAAHSGLWLEVGDKLLVTEEYNNWYKSAHKERPLVTAGKTYRIARLLLWDGALGIQAEGFYFGTMPPDIACRMHEAWLKQQGEAVER